MRRVVMRSDGREAARRTIGNAIREIRLGAGVTQAELARRAHCSQSFVSRAERGLVPGLTIDQASRVFQVLDGRLEVAIIGPLLIGERQRDPAHTRCTAAVAQRLRRAGWLTALEVQVDGGTAHGWIDVLAFDPRKALALVIEVKTELHDLGDIQRTIGWYEREAWAAARRIGWRPRVVRSCVVFLYTQMVDRRIGENSEAVRAAFPATSRSLQTMIDGGPPIQGRAIALIDPRSRRAHWLRATRLEGRRTSAPYHDYVDFVADAARMQHGHAAGREHVRRAPSRPVRPSAPHPGERGKPGWDAGGE
jgi:transcriptional regulator with XRE-family HTH domain